MLRCAKVLVSQQVSLNSRTSADWNLNTWQVNQLLQESEENSRLPAQVSWNYPQLPGTPSRKQQPLRADRKLTQSRDLSDQSCFLIRNAEPTETRIWATRPVSRTAGSFLLNWWFICKYYWEFLVNEFHVRKTCRTEEFCCPETIKTVDGSAWKHEVTDQRQAGRTGGELPNFDFSPLGFLGK